MSDVFGNYGVEIELIDKENDFLKIKETLTRIGVKSKNKNVLWQSCNILHKRGYYAILHFKELFALDGKETTFNDEDRIRRNAIVNLLKQWSLCKVVDETLIEERDPEKPINIVKFSEKKDWDLIPKYEIGVDKRKKVINNE
jgi:hypothetical protein